MERLEALAREYDKPLRGEEFVQSRLMWEDWEGMRKQAVAFAREEIGRRKWRRARGGMLPGGMDAEDVADHVLGEMLGGHRRLAPGWTWERLVKELKRLVSQRVRSLHKLKEASAMCSEWEAEGSGNGAEGSENGTEAASVFEDMVDLRGEESESEAEEEERKGRMREAIEGSLSEEAELKGLFECLWTGVTKASQIAQRLGVQEGEVGRLRKRLERRLEGMRRLKAKG